MRSKILTLFAARAFVAALVIAVPLSAHSQTLTPFDPTGSTSTVPSSINPAGAITGFYSDASFVNHGFLRAADGTIRTYDAPGAGTGSFQGTTASSINPGGEITGNYLFELGTSRFFVPRGFLRAADGTITANVDPANTFSSNPGAINPNGTIAGYYQDDITGAWHFFLRSKHGVFTTFDIPGTRQIFFATFNQGETVTGTYPDASFVIHSFLRTAHGAITTIDAPGAGSSFFQGTFVNSINPAGRITGHYTDTNYVAHGFVWSK